ncbi:MAG: hypothetical protein AVDCRST_MAG60-2444, partial [uncultured Nocardioides sp.]
GLRRTNRPDRAGSDPDARPAHAADRPAGRVDARPHPGRRGPAVVDPDHRPGELEAHVQHGGDDDRRPRTPGDHRAAPPDGPAGPAGRL